MLQVMRRVVVYHREYGCETGCCGHAVEVEGEGESHERFEFTHPGSNDEDELKEFARELVERLFGADHVADLDWENCHVYDC